jgi:hypothetical protein
MSESFQTFDTVTETKLPNPLQFSHTASAAPIIDRIGEVGGLARAEIVDTALIQSIQPPQESYTRLSIPIDFESIIADARGQSGDRFQYVIRGGNIFDFYRAEKSPDQYEADAVNLLGPDMSLYLHGAHQARRVERLMI